MGFYCENNIRSVLTRQRPFLRTATMQAQAKYFYCYSERFKRACVHNGFRVLREGVNSSTGAPYWVFIGSEIFNYYKNNLYQLERDKF